MASTMRIYLRCNLDSVKRHKEWSSATRSEGNPVKRNLAYFVGVGVALAVPAPDILVLTQSVRLR